MARRITNSQSRQTERATQMRMTARVANRIASEVASPIQASMRSAARAYENDGDSAVESAIREHEAALRRAFSGAYESSWESLGQRLLSAAQKMHGRGWQMKRTAAEELEERKRQFIAERAAKQVAKVARTTVWQTRSIIQRAIEDGEGVDGVARRIRDAAPQMARSRSLIIARTESHSAGQAAQDVVASASDVIARKGWIAAMDDRTRDDLFNHRAADGETVAKAEPFTRTGESLRHPGDFSGSPGNVIACRCGQEFIAD